MLRFILSFILSAMLIMVVGSIVLEEFPTVQPLFEEFKMHVINLYNISIVKYGMITTLLIIIAIVILVGTSKRL